MKEKMLTLYEPALEDLWFRQTLLADKETMSYNHAWGGNISFPQEQWKDWHDFWIVNHEDQRFYRYLKDQEGHFVGEIAYHYDETVKGFMANVIVYASYRGKGYGNEALELLCERAKENGIAVLYDDIAIDNPAIALFQKHGFQEEYRTDQIIMLKKEL